jgi:LUD domain
VSTTAIPDRFTTLPDEPALQATVVALEEHGFSVEVVGDLEAARQAVLARIPEGSSVMTNASVTLDQAGIADAVNDGAGQWESARNKMFALDFATQALGLDVAAFDRDRTSSAVVGRIRRDVDSGLASDQVLGTPSLFIDGVVHRGGYDPPTLLAALVIRGPG